MIVALDEVQTITIDLAARFMVARIAAGGTTGDKAYALQCVILAKTIVEQSQHPTRKAA
ncbi:hypothetical protein N8A98_06935 [Devosia neptuniae]|uniref:Uncharacterized protein n=1 Tax=Devosia neptuniae TaxID=191302 RepID=A0ABY6CIT6_9HYPH|nr:hypothetical protein [Devosia neptuniae]UXN70916.1 hypothetical protein N8A98_06935 [Devosia neptuniae]